MDQAVRRRVVLEERLLSGRRIRYETPDDGHEHDGTLRSLERGVEVFHAEHIASFVVPQWINPRGHYVYMVWGDNVVEEDGLEQDWLYVGVSSKILYRLAQHSLESAWWIYADHIDIFQYAERYAAAEMEKWAIKQFGPLYNDHYNGGVVTPARRARQRKAELAT